MIQIFASGDLARAAGAAVIAAGTIQNCDPVDGFINLRERLMEAIGWGLKEYEEISDAELKAQATQLLVVPFFDHLDGQKFEVTWTIGELTPRKNLMLLAEELDNLDKDSSHSLEKIQKMGKIWDEIRWFTPKETGAVSMLYAVLENYAHNKIRNIFLNLAEYYEIDDLAEEDDPDY
jgi:hypothetical protein